MNVSNEIGKYVNSIQYNNEIGKYTGYSNFIILKLIGFVHLICVTIFLCSLCLVAGCMKPHTKEDLSLNYQFDVKHKHPSSVLLIIKGDDEPKGTFEDAKVRVSALKSQIIEAIDDTQLFSKVTLYPPADFILEGEITADKLPPFYATSKIGIYGNWKLTRSLDNTVLFSAPITATGEVSHSEVFQLLPRRLRTIDRAMRNYTEQLLKTIGNEDF